MNIYALLGYILVCAWQPVEISKVIIGQSVDGISPWAITMLAIGMTLLQVGFFRDKAKLVYIIGNGFAAICSWILVGLYFIYR